MRWFVAWIDFIGKCCQVEGKFYQSPDMLAEYFYLNGKDHDAVESDEKHALS